MWLAVIDQIISFEHIDGRVVVVSNATSEKWSIANAIVILAMTIGSRQKSVLACIIRLILTSIWPFLEMVRLLFLVHMMVVMHVMEMVMKQKLTSQLRLLWNFSRSQTGLI